MTSEAVDTPELGAIFGREAEDASGVTDVVFFFVVFRFAGCDHNDLRGTMYFEDRGRTKAHSESTVAFP